MKPHLIPLTAFLAVCPILHAQNQPVPVRRPSAQTNQGVSESETNRLKRNYTITIAGPLDKSDPMDVTLRGSSSKFTANLLNPNRSIEIILYENGETVNVIYSLGTRVQIKTGENSFSYEDARVKGSFLATLGEPFTILQVKDSKLTIRVDPLPSKKEIKAN